MSEPFLGEITMFAGTFAPRGWHFCDGTLLSIAGYNALFALLGTTFGGNGQTTFALPDLRGRVPIHQGTGPGLPTYTIGQSEGTETVKLLTSNLPPHTHQVLGSISFKTRGDSAGNSASPNSHYVAQAPLKKYFGRTPSGLKMAPLESSNMIGNTGGPEPHNNMQPYCAVNFIIAIEGVFPSRN